MSIRLMKATTALSAALAGSVLFTVQAFACIPIATLNLSQASAAPGESVTATMVQANAKAGAISLHWKTIDGPILATAVPGAAGLATTFTVPQSAAGDYVVVATQELTPDVATWGMPARAVIHVASPGGPPLAAAPSAEAPAASRPVGLAIDQGPGLGLLAAAAAIAAAVGLALVGGAAVLLGRSSRPLAARSD